MLNFYSQDSINIDLMDYFRTLTSHVYVLFFIIHTSFIPLFYYLDIWELALFNSFSSLLYIYAVWLNAKNRPNIAFSLAAIEVSVHAYLCSVLIGDAGFSDAILYLPMLFFLHPCDLKYKLFFFFTVILLYIHLVLNDQLSSHLYDLNQNLLGVFEVMTSILLVVIDSYIAFTAYRIIRKKNS